MFPRPQPAAAGSTSASTAAALQMLLAQGGGEFRPEQYEELQRLTAPPPACVPESLLYMLPTHVHTSALPGSPKEDGEPDCVVCREAFQPGQSVTRLPCLHAYHTDCIVPWLRTSTKCPMCRSDVIEGARKMHELAASPAPARSAAAPAASGGDSRGGWLPPVGASFFPGGTPAAVVSGSGAGWQEVWMVSASDTDSDGEAPPPPRARGGRRRRSRADSAEEGDVSVVDLADSGE